MTRGPSFDLLAPVYHSLERITYGSLLHRCRTAHLHRVLKSRKALILGDGDGRFLVDLLQANRHVFVDSLDLSPSMLALARQRVSVIEGARDRVHFILADARSASWLNGGYDLIVTNFFLDCFAADELEMLIDRVAATALPNALWLDGDFRIPTGKWARAAAQVKLVGMYLFFALTTRLQAHRLTDPAPFLTANGFTLTSETTWLRGFLSSRVWVRQGLT